MPTYSDDGQWWWDGRTWQPVTTQPPPQPYAAQPTQQPYAAQQPPQPPYPAQSPYPAQQPYAGQQPGNPQYGQQWQAPQQQVAPRQLRKSRLIVGIALLAVGIPGCIVVGWHFATKDDSSQSSGQPGAAAAPQGKNLEPGQPVTEQALSEVDTQVFYESVLKRQLTAPIGVLRMSEFADTQKFASYGNGTWAITEVAIDHKQTGQFTYARTIAERPGDPKPVDLRCISGKMHTFRPADKRWLPIERDTQCEKTPSLGSDSVGTSGLTPEQADKMLAGLRDYQGYVNPAQPTLLKTGGKSYVRQVVDLKPTKLDDGNYWGSQLSVLAFRKTGLDPVEWPWFNHFNISEGIHMVYYLDPTTLLPVASFQHGIDTPAQNGNPAIKRDSVQVFNYAFPPTLPRKVVGSDPGTLTLELPEGWKVQ